MWAVLLSLLQWDLSPSRCSRAPSLKVSIISCDHMWVTNTLLPSVEVTPLTVTVYLRNFNILYNVKIGLWGRRECEEPEAQGDWGKGQSWELGNLQFQIKGKPALISLPEKEVS